MEIRYDEDLIEEAVFLCARGQCQGHCPSPWHTARFHREREKIYGLTDPDERQTAFFQLHLAWFREWGLEQVLTQVREEFPCLEKGLDALAFRKARLRSDEGAELFAAADGRRTGVLALRAEQFKVSRAFEIFLRREFMHLHDMVSPAFGYSPDLNMAAYTATQQNATRQRYRLLWDITVDGRLISGGKPTFSSKARRRTEFDHAYGFWPESRRQEIFEAVWSDPAPVHAQLLDWAKDPRQVHEAHQPLPGASCPLCGFPTHAWASGVESQTDLTGLIQREFPTWNPSEGVCQRCVETYEASRKFELPATIHL